MGVIPKLFHTIWVQGDPPPHYYDWFASWEENHPDWTHRLWVEGDYIDMLDDETRQVYESTPYDGGRKYAQQADIASKTILLQVGGVYMCADYESLRPMAHFFDTDHVVAWWETPGQMSNGVIGAPPGHPAVELAVDKIPGSVRWQRESARSINYGAGPKFIHPVWHSRDDVEKRPSEEIHPYLWFEPKPDDYGDAYAVHHWTASWK